MNYSLNSGLWFTAQLLQAGVLVALFARGWHRQFPRFTAYIILEMVSGPFLELAKGRWEYVYYFGYWATVIATTALLLAVLFEVVNHVWPTVDARQERNMMRFRWVTVGGILGLSVISIYASHSFPASPDAIPGFVLIVDRYVRIVVCGVGLFILIFRQWLGLSRREFPVGIVAGLVLFPAVHILVSTAMSHHTILHRSTLSAINSGAYVVTALIWLGYAILSPNIVLGGSAGSTPPRTSGPTGYALRALDPWWSRLKLRGFAGE
jgi:hypothetical protein